MKIIAIRLKNLTSIEGSVEIDFTMEPLSSAGIFAISGATGAESRLCWMLCVWHYMTRLLVLRLRWRVSIWQMWEITRSISQM